MCILHKQTYIVWCGAVVRDDQRIWEVRSELSEQAGTYVSNPKIITLSTVTSSGILCQQIQAQ